jgi:hypothetical protein
MGKGRLICFGVAAVLALAPACARHQGGSNVLIPRYPQAYKAYDGAPRPLNELAVVETAIDHDPRESAAFIRTINGLYMHGILDGAVDVHVPPGTHTFGLGFGGNRIILGAKSFTPEASITFDTVAGHTYRIHGRQWRMKGRSGGGRSSVYVVDVTTGERIAG